MGDEVFRHLACLLFLATVPANSSWAVPITNFPVSALAPCCSGPFPANFSAWQNTGATAQIGDSIALSATGLFAANNFFEPNVPPDGLPPNIATLSWLAPGITSYSLVGKIGVFGEPFFVGSSFSGVAAESGDLFLGVNDEFFPDNVGGFTVSGSITAVPEPSTATLLIFGVSLLWISQRGALARLS